MKQSAVPSINIVPVTLAQGNQGAVSSQSTIHYQNLLRSTQLPQQLFNVSTISHRVDQGLLLSAI